MILLLLILILRISATSRATNRLFHLVEVLVWQPDGWGASHAAILRPIEIGVVRIVAGTAIGDVAPHFIVETRVHSALLILLIGMLMLHLEIVVLLLVARIVRVRLLLHHHTLIRIRLHHHVIIRDERLLSWIRKVSRASLVEEYAIILGIWLSLGLIILRQEIAY